MPKPVETIQAEESVTPRSPLRRSCRIIAVSSSGSSEVHPVKERRLSSSSENKDDENDQILKGKRASSVTKESIEPKVEPAKTRTRRSSVTKENSVKEDEKRLAINITKSQTDETISETDKPARSRRSSVTKEDEIQKPLKLRRNSIQNEIDEEPEKKSVSGRRSVQEEKEESTPAKKVRGRRSSTQEDKEELPQRNTRSRRSASRDLFDETEESKTTRNLRSMDKSESNKEPDTKRVTRSRRSSTDAPEEEPANKLVKTPMKAKRRPSLNELIVNLEPIDEKEQESESPAKKSETTIDKKKQDHSPKNLELSIICETSFVDESENVSIKEFGASKENTESINSSLNIQSEKVIKRSRESTPTKHSPRTVSESGRSTPENVTLRKSPRIQEKLEKCKSGEHISHRKCTCEEVDSSLLSKKIDFMEAGQKQKSPKYRVPTPEKSSKLSVKSIDKKDNSANNDNLNDEDDNVFISQNVDREKINTIKTHLSDGSDGSFTIHLSQTKFETTESDLNDSKASDSSDKENSNKNLEPNPKSSANSGKEFEEFTTTTEQEIPKNIAINRISNVFRPKDIDYSFVEPMDVDTTVNLNITKMDKSQIYLKRKSQGINETFDETFSLNLSATYIEYPEEQVTSDQKINVIKEQKLNSNVELDEHNSFNQPPELKSIKEKDNSPNMKHSKSSSSTNDAEEAIEVMKGEEASFDIQKQPEALNKTPTTLESEPEDDRFSETEEILKEENLKEISGRKSETEQEHEPEIEEKIDKPRENFIVTVKMSEDNKFSKSKDVYERKNEEDSESLVNKKITPEKQTLVTENLDISPGEHSLSNIIAEEENNTEDDGFTENKTENDQLNKTNNSEVVNHKETACEEQKLLTETVLDISTNNHSLSNKMNEEDERYSESKIEDDRFSETKDISDDYEFNIPSDGEKEFIDDPPAQQDKDINKTKKDENSIESEITKIHQKDDVNNKQETETDLELVEEDEEIDIETCDTPVGKDANLPAVESENASGVTNTSDSIEKTIEQINNINEDIQTDEKTNAINKDDINEESSDVTKQNQQIDEMESSFQDIVSDDYEQVNENKVEEQLEIKENATSIITNNSYSESHDISLSTTDQKKRKMKNKLIVEENKTDQRDIEILNETAEKDTDPIVEDYENHTKFITATKDCEMQETSKSAIDKKKSKNKNKKLLDESKNNESIKDSEQLSETLENTIKKSKKSKHNSEDTKNHSEISDKLRKKKTLDEVLGREEDVCSSNQKFKTENITTSSIVEKECERETKTTTKSLEDIINSKSPPLKPNKNVKRFNREDTQQKQFSLEKWFETNEDSKQETTEIQNEEDNQPKKKKKKLNTKVTDETVLDSDKKSNANTEVDDKFDSKVNSRNSKHIKILTSKPSLEEFATSKLDEFLEQKMAEFEEEVLEEEEESEDSAGESDTDDNSFLDDMAEEEEEDTPSEDSNAIIDEGEPINTDSERSEDEEEENFEDNSFICDEEYHELLPGDEYDLGNKKKKSRILNIENRDEDIINIDRKPKLQPKKRKSRIIKVEDSSDSELEVVGVTTDQKDVSINNKTESEDKKEEDTPVKKKTSITIIENINVKEIKDTALSERINQLVDTFCTTIPKKGDVSMNLSLEYGNKETSENKKESRKKSKRHKRKHSEDVPTEEQRLSVSLTEESSDKVTKSLKRRLSQSMSDIDKKKKKRKIKKGKKLIETKSPTNNLPSTDTSGHSDYIEDLRHETFGLMNQLITDVKNRPRRVIKPSTRNINDINSSWNVEVDVKVKPSTSIVSKKETEDFKKQKSHPKDFRNQMLYGSRIKRVETKTLLRKKGAYL